MPDIDGSLLIAGAKLVSIGGHDYRAMLRDLNFAEDEPRMGKRVAWSRYVAVADRILELAGSDEEGIRWARHYADFVPFVFRAMFTAALTPQMLCKLSNAAMQPFYPPLDSSFIDSTELGSTVSLRVKPGFADARSFLLLNAGALAGITRYLGLADQEVAWDVSERAARYTVAHPRVPTLAERAKLVLDQLKPTSDDGSLLGFAESPDSAGPPRVGIPNEAPRARALRLAAAGWSLTPRQAEVLSQLVDGASNKVIAANLGCSPKTAEHHVTAIIRSADCLSRAEVVSNLWALANAYTSGHSPAARRAVAPEPPQS